MSFLFNCYYYSLNKLLNETQLKRHQHEYIYKYVANLLTSTKTKGCYNYIQELMPNILWMKTIHYLNKIRSHLVTIAPMALFTPK